MPSILNFCNARLSRPATLRVKSAQKCMLISARASRSTMSNSKAPSLSRPSTWKHLAFSATVKKGIKKEDIRLVPQQPEPVFRRQMFAPRTPRPATAMQPRLNGAIDPLRSHPVVDCSRSQHRIQVSAVTIPTRYSMGVESYFGGQPPPKAFGSQDRINQPLESKPNRFNQDAAYTQSTTQSTTQTSGSGQGVRGKNPNLKPNPSLTKQHSSKKLLPQLLAEAQINTRMQNHRNANPRLQPQLREGKLPGRIPELQMHAPIRPSINNARLNDKLIAIAKRHRPHRPLSQEGKEALDFARSSEAYRGARTATAAALQQVDSAFEPAGSKASGYRQLTPTVVPARQLPTRSSGHQAQPVFVPEQINGPLPNCLIPGYPSHSTPTTVPSAVNSLHSSLQSGRPMKPTHSLSANKKLDFNNEEFVQLPGLYNIRSKGDIIPTLQAPHPPTLHPRPDHELRVPLTESILTASVAAYSIPGPRTAYMPYNPPVAQRLAPHIGTLTPLPVNVRPRTSYVSHIRRETPPCHPRSKAPIRFSHRAALGLERYDPNSPPLSNASSVDYEEKDRAEAHRPSDQPRYSKSSMISEERGTKEIGAQAVLPNSLSIHDMELTPFCIRCTAPRVPSLKNISELNFDGTALYPDSDSDSEECE